MPSKPSESDIEWGHRHLNIHQRECLAVMGAAEALYDRLYYIRQDYPASVALFPDSEYDTKLFKLLHEAHMALMLGQECAGEFKNKVLARQILTGLPEEPEPTEEEAK